MLWAEAVFWVCVALVAVPYGVYPLMGWALGRSAKPGPAAPSYAPTVAIVLGVHNGASKLAARLDNLLAHDYPGPVHIHLGLDGCTDASEQIARSYASENQQIHVHTFKRCGKLGVLEALLPQLKASHELIALTDAGAHWAPSTLRHLVAAFHDPRIGVATAVPATQPAHADAWLEARYLHLEARLKQAEVRLTGLLLGAFGPAYAVRSAALPTHFSLTPLDDLALALHAQPRGFGGAVVPAARFFYATGAHLPSELRRKRRFGLGAGRFYATQGGQLLRRNPAAWQLLLLHKGLRWLTPFWLLGIACMGILLLQAQPWYGLATAAVFLGAQLGVLRAISPGGPWWPPLRILGYFFAAQGALLLGWMDFLRGRDGRIWQPSQRPVPSTEHTSAPVSEL